MRVSQSRLRRLAGPFNEPDRWLRIETPAGTVYLVSGDDPIELERRRQAIVLARGPDALAGILAELPDPDWWWWRAGRLTDAEGQCTAQKSAALARLVRPLVQRRAPSWLLPTPAHSARPGPGS